MANSGAQLWHQSLSWPDYLWLDFDGDVAASCDAKTTSEVYNLMDPTGEGPAKSFSAAKQTMPSQLPPTGQYQISSRVIGMLEVKVIDTDFAPKLAKYQRGIPWPDFVDRKFNQWFGRRLKDADQQIAAGKRLLPFPGARGVVIIVNERSVKLPREIVMSYLANAIHRFSNLDCIVYLADRLDGRYAPAFAFKNNDPMLSRFAVQVTMMVSSFVYSGSMPVNRSGEQPQLLARIEMDSASRAMYRSWSTGWRAADDATPLPMVSMSVSFVRREEFKSGLLKTEPDQTLLDCTFAWNPGPPWDPGVRNLRVVNPGAPESNPKELFPTMPQQVFDLCFRPVIAFYGWPFSSVHDETKDTAWERFFAACSMHQWSKFTWESGFHKLSTSELHPQTRQAVDLILQAHRLGERNAASNILKAKERFEWLSAFVREQGKLPAPVIGACTNKGLMLFDGHIRLAVLLDLKIAEGFDLPMWLASAGDSSPQR